MSPLLPDERRQADRLALEIAGLIRDSGVSTKKPLLQAVMTRALYLVGLEPLLAPERAEAANGSEEEKG